MSDKFITIIPIRKILIKKVSIIFALINIFSSLLFSQTDYAKIPDNTTPSEIKGIKLIWSDEFNVDGKPDSTKWTYEKGFVRNKELQWYQPGNAFCSNGVLVIEGRRENKKNPGFDSLSKDWRKTREYAEYTSACLLTKGLADWQYGRFEIRARIDTSKGLWPAIWTLGIRGQWPWNGEIDIMEFYRINDIPHILANVAWGTEKRYKAKWDSEKIPISKLIENDKDWASEFHIWRMDWDNDSIVLYIDGMKLNTTLLNEAINPDSTNPFHQPHYLLLNLAIGENGGDPSKTHFPVKYEIDYVRIYQKE